VSAAAGVAASRTRGRDALDVVARSVRLHVRPGDQHRRRARRSAAQTDRSRRRAVRDRDGAGRRLPDGRREARMTLHARLALWFSAIIAIVLTAYTVAVYELAVDEPDEIEKTGATITPDAQRAERDLAQTRL